MRVKKFRQIYCQECGKEITNEGGVIDTHKRVLCSNFRQSELSCSSEYLLEHVEEEPFLNYSTPEKIQESIGQGLLEEFGPLEKVASS